VLLPPGFLARCARGVRQDMRTPSHSNRETRGASGRTRLFVLAVAMLLVLGVLVMTSIPTKAWGTQGGGSLTIGPDPPAVSDATIQTEQSSLTLPSGHALYIYGYATGGASQSNMFSSGQYASVVNSAGNTVASLALTTSNTNSFTTGTSYYTIGGIDADGFSTYTASYSSNNTAGAASATDNFRVDAPGSLVVVFAIGGAEQCVAITSSLTFTVDATNSNSAGLPVAMVIAHGLAEQGNWSVTEHSQQCATGQNPNNAGDLIGVVVLVPSTATTSNSTGQTGATTTPGNPSTNSGSGNGNSNLLYVGIAAGLIILFSVLLIVLRRRSGKAAHRSEAPPVAPKATAQPTGQIGEPNPQPSKQAASVSPATVEKLQRLKSLLDEGLITQADFDEQTARLMNPSDSNN
jgi:hypothetical protein